MRSSRWTAASKPSRESGSRAKPASGWRARSGGSTRPPGASSRWANPANGSRAPSPSWRWRPTARFLCDDPDRPAGIELTALNFGAYPMGSGLSRLETRFPGEPERVEAFRGRAANAAEAEELGLVTFAPDDLDWEDELRVAVEERAGFSPDALTGMEASLRFAGPETMETPDIRPAFRLAELDLPASERHRRARRPCDVRQTRARRLRPEAHLMSELDSRIPNNVALSGDPRLQRALLRWQPAFLNWWNQMGPEGFQGDDVLLRTAVSVEPSGWSHFDFVRMPDYRWGIFLAPRRKGPPDRLRRPRRPAGLAGGSGRVPPPIFGGSSSPRETPNRRASNSSASSGRPHRAFTTCATSSR